MAEELSMSCRMLQSILLLSWPQNLKNVRFCVKLLPIVMTWPILNLVKRFVSGI